MAEKKASKTIEGDVITIAFSTGETLVTDLGQIPQDIQHRLAMHGLSQKLGDSYAGADDEERFGKADGVAKDLLDGNWSTRVAAGSPRTTQLAEALAAATQKTIEEAITKLEEMEDDAKKQLRKHPLIVQELSKIKAKKATEDAEKAAKAAATAEPLVL